MIETHEQTAQRHAKNEVIYQKGIASFNGIELSHKEIDGIYLDAFKTARAEISLQPYYNIE